MNVSPVVAVIEPSGLVGETLLTYLDEREFPLSELIVLGEGEAVDEMVRFRGKRYTVKELADFDFSGVDIAFLCGGSSQAENFAEEIAACGAIVIDASGYFSGDLSVPAVVPEVNAHSLAGVEPRNLVANPNSAATALAMALKPVQDAVGINRISATVCEAVSAAGRGGVEELSRQTIDLLNLRSMESRQFAKQIAFNVLAQTGESLANGYTRREMQIAEEMRFLLDDAELQVHVSVIQVPVFFGSSLAVQVETRDEIAPEMAMDLLRQMPGVVVMEGDFPSAVTEGVNNDAVYVGRIHKDMSQAYGLSLWIVVDNIRKGAALNMVQIAEILVKVHI